MSNEESEAQRRTQEYDDARETTDKWKFPQLGQNVVKFVKLARACGNIGCYQLVYVAEVDEISGAEKFHCPEHGLRNRKQMKWLDITGSTTLEYRTVGL